MTIAGVSATVSVDLLGSFLNLIRSLVEAWCLPVPYSRARLSGQSRCGSESCLANIRLIASGQEEVSMERYRQGIRLFTPRMPILFTLKDEASHFFEKSAWSKIHSMPPVVVGEVLCAICASVAVICSEKRSAQRFQSRAFDKDNEDWGTQNHLELSVSWPS